METNLEKYKNALDKLIEEGGLLFDAMKSECSPDEFEKQSKEIDGEYLDYKKIVPNFLMEYQSWYSEALMCVKQLLPDRIKDFTELYRSTIRRKEINLENYTVSDYLQGFTVKLGGQIIKKEYAAIPKFIQQWNILTSIKKRFESSLFDIKQLAQADLFDSELDAARELNEKGFTRGAGAIAGVVLERHLSQVCENHIVKVKSKYKYPSINECNQSLKKDDVIEIETFDFIKFLADLRNLCDHNKEREPKKEEIEELIDGVDKITKTLK